MNFAIILECLSLGGLVTDDSAIISQLKSLPFPVAREGVSASLALSLISARAKGSFLSSRKSYTCQRSAYSTIYTALFISISLMAHFFSFARSVRLIPKPTWHDAASFCACMKSTARFHCILSSGSLQRNNLKRPSLDHVAPLSSHVRLSRVPLPITHSIMAHDVRIYLRNYILWRCSIFYMCNCFR